MAETQEELAAYEVARAAEFGTYVANAPIYINGALAYADGQAVPVSNVDKYGYLEAGLVRKASDPPPAPVAPAPAPVGEPISLDAVTTPLPVDAPADPGTSKPTTKDKD